MVLRCVVACALLASCGRFGFSARDDAAADDGDDSGINFAPLSINVGTFSTTSATFVDITNASLTLPPSSGTRWLVLTSAALESTLTAGVSVEARYVVAGVEHGIGGTENSAPARPGPWQHVDVIDGTDTPQQLVYQLRDASAGTATISALHAVAIPLAADAVAFASVDAVQNVTALTLMPHTALSLGALSGDYVFLMLANASDLPGQSDVYVHWRGPADEVWLTDTQLPREGWQSVLAMQRATVDSSAISVTFHSYVGGGTSQVRYVRVVALRVDAFASVDFARDDTSLTTFAFPATPAATVTTTASSASHHAFVGSLRLEEPCDGSPDAERAVHMVVDSTTETTIHATDNCAYASSYGGVGLLASHPAQVTIGYSTLNGEPIIYDGAQMLVLGLP